jgi:zinc transport system ATP-binding protein
MQVTPPALALYDGRVALGASVVLDGIDFCVHEGEFVALLGPNGSGKTTLVRALLGIVPLVRGSIEIFGVPLERFHAWERIGYVPQRVTAATGVPATVFEVVLSGRVARSPALGSFRRPDRDAAGRALESVGLAHLAGRPVATLSGGQQQRVLIARALAGEPDVLVLDEPVSSADLQSQHGFSETLGALDRAGRSVLVVTHSLGPMKPLVERAVVLGHGRVVYDGAPRAEDAVVGHPHPHHHESSSGNSAPGRIDVVGGRRP